ncbi:MAG TPA: class I SAM-dependent methyltransferase [Bacteroidales bacterium]|nr:class I SAM-dependent methyltransferase [Bacteroidales bacterium]
MNIELIRKLSNKPQLYEKGTAVMWTDPYISKQLLEMHLNPDNDAASRNHGKIENTVNWMLERTGKPGLKVLDMGCGPGLYTELFAQRGHSVTGVDFSENSIQYAIEQAKEKKLNIKYFHMNYLDLDFDNQFDLIILIYLDFCVLLPDERDKVLRNIYRALKKGGFFICDVVNEKNIDKKTISPSWEIQESGFWKNSPYIALTNGYHYPEAKVLANHHIVITEKTVDTYVFWSHYFEKHDLVQILESKGFKNIEAYENVLPESNDCWNGENVTFFVAAK